MTSSFRPTLIEDVSDPGTFLIQNMSAGSSVYPDYPSGSQEPGFNGGKLTWGDVGSRFFESGVDRGVLFTENGNGIAWTGLISVSGSYSGGDVTPYYLDGVKYLNVPSRKEYAGKIDAFMYPPEFADYDGWATIEGGLLADEQYAKPFSLSYRTRIGNDVAGVNFGYKLHLIYGAIATPSESAYTSANESVEAMTFSWSFTTTPQRIASNVKLMPLSHLVIDSTKTEPSLLRFIEENLYGSSRYDSKMLSLERVVGLFEDPMQPLNITPQPLIGLSDLRQAGTISGDLWGRVTEGLYTASDTSRLTPTYNPGLYTLEP